MSSQDNEITISETISDLALIALEYGMADRRSDPDFAPFVLIVSGGHCYVRRLTADDHAIEAAAEFLAREPDSTSTYALAYDGTVTVDGTPFDAVLVIAGERGAGAFVFTQRYDAAVAPIGEPAFIGQHESLLHKVP